MSDQRSGAPGWLSNNQANIQLASPASPGGAVSGAALDEGRDRPERGGPRFVTVPDQRASHWAGRPGVDQILPPHVTDGETEAGNPCACLPGGHTVIGWSPPTAARRGSHCLPQQLPLRLAHSSCAMGLAARWGSLRVCTMVGAGERHRMSTGFTSEDATSSLHATTWRVPRAGAGVRHPGLTLELAQVEGGCLKVSAPHFDPWAPRLPHPSQFHSESVSCSAKPG